MFNKYLSLSLAVLLTHALIAAPALLARPHGGLQAQSVEQIKIKVAKLGVGAKARATVRFKDGSKLKGYVAEVRDNEFVFRDRQTDEPRIISYQDVAKVESNRGHSLARNLGIGIAIGAGAVLAILFGIIAAED